MHAVSAFYCHLLGIFHSVARRRQRGTGAGVAAAAAAAVAAAACDRGRQPVHYAPRGIIFDRCWRDECHVILMIS